MGLRKLISRKYLSRKTKKNIPEGPDPYHTAILSLLATKPKIHIVVVGANDGKHADPVYELVRAEIAEHTSVTLFEPQKALIPFLAENYAFHQDCRIINKAIGPDEELTLYSIRPEYWSRITPPYAKDWPEYRAATGGTSTSRERVVKFVQRFIPNESEASAAVEEHSVPSTQLAKALVETGADVVGVDVLQVDAEGFDDQVILNADIERFLPSIIRFESRVIPQERLERLFARMQDLGYVFFPMGIDTLCIRALDQGSPTSRIS